VSLTFEAITFAPSRKRFGETYMSWYAYCLTEQQTQANGTRTRRPFLLEGIQGVNGAPVLSYPSGEFSVIVSEYDRAIENGKMEEKMILEHARVVSVCFRSGTVLPFRFGTLFDSDEALRQAVRANRRAFGQSVEKLRGKSEMHLKVLIKDGALREAFADVPLPDTVGGDYLMKLREKASKDRERSTKARALSVQVHKLFNPLEEEVSCKRVNTNGMLIDIAHLIDSKSVEKYQNRYTSAAKQLKNCELVISGPWPPYHFLPGKLRTVAGNS
jgi:Gas vesicle synthesis protein GvpL/GvpF